MKQTFLLNFLILTAAATSSILAQDIKEGIVFSVDASRVSHLPFSDLMDMSYEKPDRFEIAEFYTAWADDFPKLIDKDENKIRISAVVEGNICGRDAQVRYSPTLSAWALVYIPEKKGCPRVGIPVRIEIEIQDYFKKSNKLQRSLILLTKKSQDDLKNPSFRIEAVPLSNKVEPAL